jgi:hypothetical protein
VLRRIFVRKRKDITEEWRKLHKKELNDRYSSQHIIWLFKSIRMRWVGHIARMEESTGAYRVFFGGGSKGKSPLGGCRHRWEDNIRIDLQEVGWVA